MNTENITRVAARPEYGSVFRVSLPITGLLSSWSLDNIIYTRHKYKYHSGKTHRGTIGFDFNRVNVTGVSGK